MKPLTNIQRAALEHIAGKPGGKCSGYDLKRNKCGNLATMQQLANRGCVRAVGQGHMAFPASADWVITDAGHKILEN